MALQRLYQEVTVTSPASETTEIAADIFDDLLDYDWFSVDADLTGATGGTLDVYIQRWVENDVWRDWIAFPQIAAGVAVAYYSAQSGGNTTIQAVGNGTDSAATPALAANSFVGGHPGRKARVVLVAGAATSAGASQVIRLTAWKSRH